MKILVTGREGQVARALAQVFAQAISEGRLEVEFLARPAFDLAAPDKIREQLASRKFDIIINAAAYTSVDDAEDEPDLAHQINAVAPGVIAEIAASRNAVIIHLSTDYVFDGNGDRPWSEDDSTGPLGVYGRTKLEGENAVRAAAPDNHVIVRTAWVYSPFGNNFVKSMLRLAETRDQVSVVNDRFGSPTSALDVAQGINRILEVWLGEVRATARKGLGSTFHLAGEGQASWCDLARQTFMVSDVFGGPGASVNAIQSSQFPSKTKRPANSRLDSTAFYKSFGWRPDHWQVSLRTVVEILCSPPPDNQD